ncbi:EamA family transporter [Corynebacterium halotolerans]|uniref:EamA family transporter n=1 Tax=Corynebacterium halotolerans TaxID=225326 RepID=UPI003CF2E34D
MDTHHPGTALRGVLASIGASALFGFIFFISGAISASATTVFTVRVLVTAACYTLVLTLPAARSSLRQFLRSLTATPWQPLIFVLLTALIALQLWLFAWTPVHGHALDASLGYLLLPISLVIIGRFIFRFHVTRMQWMAVLIAVVAVSVKAILNAHLSWVTLAICFGYALYFSIRKHFHLDGPMAYGAEVWLLSPFSIWLLLQFSERLDLSTNALVILAGLSGALAMALYLAASTLLSMPVFGLLSYGEPLLLFVVALLLGEQLVPSDSVVYGLLAIALIILAVDGFQRSRQAL